MEPHGDGDHGADERQASEEAHGQHALGRGHVDVHDIVDTGRRDDDGEELLRLCHVGVVRSAVVEPVMFLPPDITDRQAQVRQLPEGSWDL